MFIVTRNLRQSVIVGEFDSSQQMLKVTVVGVSGTKVQLGFEVVMDGPDKPPKTGEQLADGEPNPVTMPGMATTQEFDWDWEDDGIDEAIFLDHGKVPGHVKKPISSGNQADQ
jgi:hypothetical protein